MDKLKFIFESKLTTDGKSNFIAITSIVTQDDKVFLVPEECQEASLHKPIYTSKAYVTVKNTLKKRHQTRSVWIKMTEEISQTYVDADKNMIFQDQFLEEITQERLSIANKSSSDDPIVKILKKLVENQQKNEKQSMKKLADRFVLEKINGKNISACHWMEVFEKECARFDITRDEEKIEIFRLFLDKSCTDWYSSMMIKLGLQSEWLDWKSNFLQTYGDKGWTASRYALSFKYQSGSLLEYAVKKERLLLEVRKTIDQGTLIDIIATGLPDYITDRINKDEIIETKDLFNELGKLEHLVSKKKYIIKKDDTKPLKEKCSICEKLNKGSRFHSEAACWFKTKEGEKFKRDAIKHVNNSAIETELNEKDSKNE